MWSKLLLFGGLGVVAARLACGQPQGDARGSAVSVWSFDGHARDHAGAHADLLRPVGTPPPGHARFVSAEDIPLTDGQAVALGVEEGDAGSLTAPLSADLRLGADYTIEAWIYPLDVAGWRRLVLRWAAPPRLAYHLAVHVGRVSLHHGQSDGHYPFAEGGAVSTGRWHHVAGVARRNPDDPTRSRLEVYLDGQCVGTGTYDGTVGDPDGEGIGVGDSAAGTSPDCRFRGYVDRIGMHGRALTPAVIRCLYEERGDELRAQKRAARKAIARRCRQRGVNQIVFAERGFGRDYSGHYYANFGYAADNPDVWFHAADGTALRVLDAATGEATDLLRDDGGSVRDPHVHYDGARILFSYRPAGTHRYHLFEIGVDGSSLRQLTGGDHDDLEPTYLPDGGIAFCSTRSRRWIGCWLAQSATLFRCDADGRSIRRLSSGTFTENTPAVLPDGRILYTRWEYVNRDPFTFHHLWTMNPDGTNAAAYFGNMIPGGVFIDAKPVPNSDRVVMIHSPGHGRNEHLGRVATLTGRRGPNARATYREVSAGGQYRDPYPLADDAFLVAAGSNIELMDGEGRTVVLGRGRQAVHEPQPIRTRPRERTVAPRRDPSQRGATVLLDNAYAGRSMAGVPAGTVRRLLVLEDLPKPVNFHGGGSQPIGHGVTSTLKRILGTVPVAADGSACFRAPTGRSLYVVLLDERGRSIKQMRSFFTLQPGESVSCVGCHERRERTPDHGRSRLPLALRQGVSRIEPMPDVPAIIDFPRDVQPILDRHCVGCHGPDKRSGGVSLTGDRGPVFSESYYTLFLSWQIKDTGGPPRHGSGRQTGNDRPYTTYSSASALMDKVEPTHHRVRASEAEKRLVALWIDTGATYPGTYAAYGTGQVGGCWRANQPTRAMADDWASSAAAAEAIERRCGACHPAGQLPRHVTARTATDHGDFLSWTRPLSRFSRHHVFNLSRPGRSLVLSVPLAPADGGYASSALPAKSDRARVVEDRGRPPAPAKHPVVFRSRDDPDYRAILAHLVEAKAYLETIGRFDMPGFRPHDGYVREMKRYGVLAAGVDPVADPIDVYATDQAYFELFHHRPAAEAEGP